MSRVYFHTRDADTEDAELRGSERAYAGVLCGDLCAAVLDIDSPPLNSDARYRRLLPAGAFPLDTQDRYAFMRHLRLYLTSTLSDGQIILPGTDERMPAWELGLNTAIVLGGDALRLLAKLHAQCEIHAYIEGHNRAWLASVIDEGLATRILRPQMAHSPSGWESVATLLRAHDDSPIVLSYSVTDQFPNRYVAQWTAPSGNPDDWYDLPFAERWELAMTGLRAGVIAHGVEWSPETWRNGFGDHPTYSAFDIMAAWGA